MSKQEDAKLGFEAEQAMTVLERAFDDAIAQEVKVMLNTPVTAQMQVLAHHAAIAGIDKARQAVKAIIANGKLAQNAIKHEQKLGGAS